MLGAVLLATLALAPEVEAQAAKPAVEANKKTAVPVAPAAATAAPKGDPAPKPQPQPAGKLPSFIKTPAARKAKAPPSRQDVAPAPALEPAPPVPEKMTEAAFVRRRAMVALNTGRYEEAIKAFEEAYALEQDPILLFRLAQAYRLSGQPVKALDACEAYLRSADKNNPERAQVEQFLAEVEMIAYQIRLQREYGMLPRPGALPPLVPPPSSSPSLAEATKDPQAAPKHEASRSDLTSVPTPPPVQSTPFYKRTYFWVAVGGVVAAGATAAIWYAASSRGSRAPQTGLGYQGAYQ
jgi:tetratricopeptide (TPR) repeat protein